MTIPVIVAGGADHIGAGRDYLKHLHIAGSFEDACPTAARHLSERKVVAESLQHCVIHHATFIQTTRLVSA
jgi:hypothetical protein